MEIKRYDSPFASVVLHVTKGKEPSAKEVLTEMLRFFTEHKAGEFWIACQPGKAHSWTARIRVALSRERKRIKEETASQLRPRFHTHRTHVFQLVFARRTVPIYEAGQQTAEVLRVTLCEDVAAMTRYQLAQQLDNIKALS